MQVVTQSQPSAFQSTGAAAMACRAATRDARSHVSHGDSEGGGCCVGYRGGDPGGGGMAPETGCQLLALSETMTVQELDDCELCDFSNSELQSSSDESTGTAMPVL